MMIVKKITVKGKVQGVFYRQSAKTKAGELNIAGTVENLPDGHTVEIFALGTDEQLAAFIEWCKKGPPKAVVNNIEITESLIEKTFTKFSIL